MYLFLYKTKKKLEEICNLHIKIFEKYVIWYFSFYLSLFFIEIHAFDCNLFFRYICKYNNRFECVYVQYSMKNIINTLLLLTFLYFEDSIYSNTLFACLKYNFYNTMYVIFFFFFLLLFGCSLVIFIICKILLNFFSFSKS